MKIKSLALGLMLALSTVATPQHAMAGPSLVAATATMAPAAYSAADPARQMEDLAHLFRANDVAGMAQALMPPSRWEALRLAYQVQQLQPTRAEDRDRFATEIQRIIAPDAVDRLMEEFEPKLEQARPQAPGALMLAMGAMHMAATSKDSKLTAEQRAALQSALPGVQAWATSTDFLDSHTLRQALTVLTDAARRTGVSSLDQLKAMPLETALNRAGTLLVAAKQAVLLYGLDLDAIVDSLQVEVVAIEDESARVRTTITVFDAPIWAEHDLVLLEGRWYGKHATVRWEDNDHHHDRDRDDEQDADRDVENVKHGESSKPKSARRS